MDDLNLLTVANLEKLAKECGISLKKSARKSDKIKRILDGNIEELKLKELINKYRKKKREKKSNAPSNMIIQKLEERINILEKQVHYLLAKNNSIKEDVFGEKEFEAIITFDRLNEIKNTIKTYILPGASITIDELIRIRGLQEIPLISLKQAVDELINDGILEASEGRSVQKIRGQIGKLTRKL